MIGVDGMLWADRFFGPPAAVVKIHLYFSWPNCGHWDVLEAWTPGGLTSNGHVAWSPCPPQGPVAGSSVQLPAAQKCLGWLKLLGQSVRLPVWPIWQQGLQIPPLPASAGFLRLVQKISVSHELQLISLAGPYLGWTRSSEWRYFCLFGA